MLPKDLPDDELHLAPASRVHQDRNQLWVPGAKDAMRPDGDREETLLLITCSKDQLEQRQNRKESSLIGDAPGYSVKTKSPSSHARPKHSSVKENY